MLRCAFNCAAELGIHSGIGSEPDWNPAEIVRAPLPEVSRTPFERSAGGACEFCDSMKPHKMANNCDYGELVFAKHCAR